MDVYRMSLQCGKRKKEGTRIQQKKFINYLKYGKNIFFCNCIAVYKIYEGNANDKLSESFSRVKYKNLKNENQLVERYKYMIEKF